MRKSRVNEPGERTLTGTSRRVSRRKGMSLENARAADCGGGLSRLAKPPTRGSPAVGDAKSIPREHVLHPFQLRRRHSVGATEGSGRCG